MVGIVPAVNDLVRVLVDVVEFAFGAVVEMARFIHRDEPPIVVKQAFQVHIDRPVFRIPFGQNQISALLSRGLFAKR